MPTGYPLDPLSLAAEDDAAFAPQFSSSDVSFEEVPDPRFNVALGAENPYFDMPARGDPGGLGYYLIDAQYELLGSPTASLCMCVQAATPAGLESDGVASGPTRLRPSLAYFQELDDGWAVHGFLGRNVTARSHWSEDLQRGWKYGVAVQRPLPGLVTDTGEGLHFFVEALVNSHGGVETVPSPEEHWQLLPGLHWRLRDDWWVSGGFILPLRGQRPDLDLWHVTCSCRF